MMDAPGGDGWVREGDLAPSFELPDSKFKPVSPIGANTKVNTSAPSVFTKAPSVYNLVHHAECIRSGKCYAASPPGPIDRFQYTR